VKKIKAALAYMWAGLTSSYISEANDDMHSAPPDNGHHDGGTRTTASSGLTAASHPGARG
jgi:hypothetical protein